MLQVMNRSSTIALLIASALAWGCTEGSDVAPDVLGDAAAGDVSSSPVVLSEADFAAAESDYVTYCALCHGDQGEGYKADGANALNHPAFLATASDELLRTSIERGRPGTPMSAWGEALGGPLDEAQVDRLVAYIRSWQVGPGLDLSGVIVEGEVNRAKPQYAARCAGCHGEQGEGGSFMSLNSPEFLSVVSDGYIREAIASGREGTPMGSYIGVIPEQTLDDLVVLIRSWETPQDNTPFVAPEVDFDNAIIHPGGVEPTFDEALYIPADDLKAQLDGAGEFIIVDARPSKDYTTGHITGSISVPFYSVAEVADQFPPDVTVITYCGCPHAESTIAAQALIDAGRDRVYVLDEGYYVWSERGYPVTEGTAPGLWAIPPP